MVGSMGALAFSNLSPCFLIWIYDPDKRVVMTLRFVEVELSLTYSVEVRKEEHLGGVQSYAEMQAGKWALTSKTHQVFCKNVGV